MRPEMPSGANMSEYATDLIAERLVLASVLAAPTQSANIFGILPTDVWTDYRCSLVATVLAERYQRNIPIERLGLLRECADRAGTDHKAKQIGEFIYELGGTDLPPGGLGYYAERIVSLATIRRAHSAAIVCQQKLIGAADLDDDDIFRGALTDMRQACDDALVSFKAQPLDPPLSAADLLTGSDEYDWLVPGLLEYTDRLIITGSEGLGKALAIDTPVPTPKGWTTMGSLTVGSEVFGLDGKPTRVVAATDVMHGRPCYRVTFSDGAEIVADEQHMWLTETLLAREAAAKLRRRPIDTKPQGTDQRHKRTHFPAVITTGYIASTLSARNGHALNHSIQTSTPLQYPAQELPVDPYVIGAWLGDGTTTCAQITCADPEILENIEAAGYSLRQSSGLYHWSITRRAEIMEARRQAADLVRSGLTGREACRRVGISSKSPLDVTIPQKGYHFTRSGVKTEAPMIQSFTKQLRDLDLLGNKHIPEMYQRGSVEQRLALLQGLMDTDGTVSVGSGQGRGGGAALCELSLCNERLARDAHELLLGLGIKVPWREAPATLNGRVVGTRYRLAFQTDLPIFRLTRKAERLGQLRTRRSKLRYITAVAPIESVPVRCIQVEQSDGMFIVGRECIPTHNSILSGQIAATVAAGIHPFSTEPLPKRSTGYRVLVVDCENSRRQLRRRFRSLLKQVDEACKNNGIEPTDWNTALRFVIRPEGISLTEPRELTRMEQAVTATAPDLLVIGPMYRLSKVDVRDEQAAKELTDTIDLLRVRHNLTVVIETHAGHSTNSTGTRHLRPLGSSLFMRWPEFGYGLRTAPEAAHEEHPSVVEVGAWRGARDERNWPQRLRHGKTLPWEPADPEYWDRPTLREVS
jgi:replicative DNA helicase